MVFLRDPVTRFESGYYSRQRQGQPRYHAPWSDTEQRAFERFATPNELAVALSSSDDEQRQAAEAAMAAIAHVRDSFSKWLGDEAYLRSRADDIVFIGFQERLADDFARLLSLLVLPTEIELPDDDVLAHRNPQADVDSLTPEAIENLRRWYDADYRLLGVCEEFADASHGSKAPLP